MTPPAGGAGGSPPGGMSMGEISKTIGDAAKPSQAQTGEALKAQTGALNSAAQATSPNATDAAKTASGTPAPAPRTGGPGTAAANADPNAPRT